MSLGLPVAATVNCADNTGAKNLYHFSEGNQRKAEQVAFSLCWRNGDGYCEEVLEAAGILQELANYLDAHIPNVELIASAIGIVSAIIDNVPLVAATMGMYDLTSFTQDSEFWQLFAYCAGTGGSMLVIGSAAVVAFMGMEKVDFFWYLQKEDIDALIRCVANNIGFSQERPVAAITIFKCLHQWKSFEAERTSVFDRLIQMIGSAIEVDIRKALTDEGVEAANKLVHSGKEHRSSWLIGRLVRNKESKSKSSSTSYDASSVPDHYVSDWTAKIRAQLQQKMDENFDQKVQEMMQKLSDQNLDLKLKLDDSKQLSEMSSWMA